ncbi:MAG: hypothetical protein ACREXK_07380 [Gammaproteobacteria bacterium]
MAELKMSGAVKTKVVPYKSTSGQKLNKILKKGIDKKTKEKKPTEKKPKKEIENKPELDETYGAFMVMEFAQDLTNLARLDDPQDPSRPDFDTLVESMKGSNFFYDLGRIHGADMYMGNEDRLQDARTAIKNIFVNEVTGKLLPIDLGLVAVGQDRATKGFVSTKERNPLPASVQGRGAEDWVNLTITGSFEENRQVRGKKTPTTTKHGRRGAAFFTPDFRLAVLGKGIGNVWKTFKDTIRNPQLNVAIDDLAVEKQFRQGVSDAIEFYTSQTQGYWAKKVEDVKTKFELGPDEMLYLDVGVFALKDRYAQLIAAGHGDDDVRKHLAKEVESGQQLPIATLTKSEVVPTGTLQLPGRASGSMTTSPTDTSTATTTTTTTTTTTMPTVPTPTANAAQSPLHKPTRTGIPAIGGTFNPFVSQYSGMAQAPEPSKSQEEEKGAQGGQLWKVATLGGVQSGTRIVGPGRRGRVGPSDQDASATTTTTATAPATTPLPSYPSTDIAATGGSFSPMPPAVVEHLMLLAQELAEISESAREEEREKEKG